MTTPLLIFLTITGLFLLLLPVKSVSKAKFCVICLSVSASWLTLLVLFELHYFDNIVFLALLMGQSITGIYYLLEKKTSEKYHVFRLPTLLTLTLTFYATLQPSLDLLSTFYFLAFLWLIFSTLFFYRKSAQLRGLVQKIIECCRDW